MPLIHSSIVIHNNQQISRMMPDAGLLAHLRVITCLLLIMACGGRCLAFCLRLPTTDWSGILLLSFECFVLLVEGSQTLVKYAADAWQALHAGGEWTGHASFIYHTELVTDVTVQCATLAHYAHILLLHGISILDALLLLDMRLVLGNLRARISHYRHYRTVSQRMDSILVDADKDLLASTDDVCAICRDALTQGVKKLPCSHLFHGQCLLAWLQQNSSCPTCRRALFATTTPTTPAQAPPSQPAQEHSHAHMQQQQPRNHNAHRHHHHHHHHHHHLARDEQIWRFGPLGALSPSISVRGFTSSDSQEAAAAEEEANVNMVLAMFPQLSAEVVRADLRRTHSVALTVERALENRL